MAAIDARFTPEVYELRAALDTGDFSFHDFVYQLAGNRLISAAAHMNWHHVRRSILMLARKPIRLGPFWDNHDSVLRAVIDGDPAVSGGEPSIGPCCRERPCRC